MRLLITTDTVGGVWTYTRELSEGLLSCGHAVSLVSMGRLPSADQQEWTWRTAARWPHTFHYLATDYPLEWMAQNQACYSAAEGLLLRQVDSFQPDLLHLNQFCYGALPTRVPKVVMAHSDVMSWSECCRGALPASSAWYDQYLLVVRLGLLQADAVVAPTRWMLNALCGNYDVPGMRAVIANGRALPAPATISRRKLQAVTVGRVWDEGKNVRVLEEISARMPVLVAGELALETEPPFVSASLRTLGPLAERDTLALFAESAVYIATSLYEPFGLAPVEAALSGCAILAHDIPSLREVWAGSALYFASAADLEAHLEDLYNDPKLLASRAKGACMRARALYSRDAMTQRYLELYELLGAPVPGGGPMVVQEPEAEHVS